MEIESNKKQKNWKIVEPSVFNFEKIGDVLEGVLINRDEQTGKFDSTAYYLENEKGSFVVFGTTVLDRIMKLVKLNEEIMIEFVKTEPSDKGNDTKIFKVYKRDVGGTVPPASSPKGGDEK